MLHHHCAQEEDGDLPVEDDGKDNHRHKMDAHKAHEVSETAEYICEWIEYLAEISDLPIFARCNAVEEIREFYYYKKKNADDS